MPKNKNVYHCERQYHLSCYGSSCETCVQNLLVPDNCAAHLKSSCSIFPHYYDTECILARQVFSFFTWIKTSYLTQLLFFQLLTCFPFLFSGSLLLFNHFRWPTVQFYKLFRQGKYNYKILRISRFDITLWTWLMELSILVVIKKLVT